MDTRVENKNTIIFSTLSQIFGGQMNLARIKFFGLFISALCKVQTVCFEKLAAGFDSEVNVGSSLRRIQRFMAEYLLDTDLIALIVFALLPHKPPYRVWHWTEPTGNSEPLTSISWFFPLFIKVLPFPFFTR
jgi:hypothetical protein